MGRTAADRIVVGGSLVNLATAGSYPAGVALSGERIAAIAEVDYTRGPETVDIDAGGRFLDPSLVDGHPHMYHSYLGVQEFVEALVSRGVTATADGFCLEAASPTVESVRVSSRGIMSFGNRGRC
jgi:adenine deaminase